jgi:transposase
MLHIYFGEFAF